MTETFDIETEVVNCLEWTLEDRGIGHYEFWGMLERDVNMQPVLEFNEVTIKIDGIKEKGIEDEWIPLEFENNTQAWVGEDSFSVCISATLVSVKSVSYKVWEVTYEVGQLH
mgnify:CR=1 FL=1|tara:strand:+ start:339 stop:674 length:336 start_codon:yes stop_codon:yes gene_type:complete